MPRQPATSTWASRGNIRPPALLIAWGDLPRTCWEAYRLGVVPSQVMGQGLGDVPVVPELRFAPRRTRPRIPGRAARGGATDPGLPLCGSFFHRQMSRRSARAGVGDCLHESTPPSRSGQACRSFFPIGRLQTVARHNKPCFYAGRPVAVPAVPRISHHPGIAHPHGGITPTRRTGWIPWRARLSGGLARGV
jgi:hypothetical protein